MCGLLEHAQSPCFHLTGNHVWVCVWMAALKAIVKRIYIAWGLWTCMLPRDLIWERVAPSHTGVTQLSDWPGLHAMFSSPESCLNSCGVLYKLLMFMVMIKPLGRRTVHRRQWWMLPPLDNDDGQQRRRRTDNSWLHRLFGMTAKWTNKSQPGQNVGRQCF